MAAVAPMGPTGPTRPPSKADCAVTVDPDESSDDEEEDPEDDIEDPDIDPALVEKHSVIRAAIPVLPIHLAMICFVANVFLPGLGTFASGCLVLCLGHPRFSARTVFDHRLGACLVNVAVAVAQTVTVIMCLVGWCWSIGWGVTIVTIAKQNEDFLCSVQQNRLEEKRRRYQQRQERRQKRIREKQLEQELRAQLREQYHAYC